MHPPARAVSCSWLGQRRPAASDCATGWTLCHRGFPLISPLRRVLFRKLILFHHLLLAALLFSCWICWQFFFSFLSRDALNPYHSSPIGRHHLHVDAFIAEVLWCPAHKIKICRLMRASCSEFEYFWGLNPHIHPFYVSTGTKCCAEHKYAYMQPLRHFFFYFGIQFSSVLSFA